MPFTDTPIASAIEKSSEFKFDVCNKIVMIVIDMILYNICSQ